MTKLAVPIDNNEILPGFRRHNARAFDLSVDTILSHLAFEDDLSLEFPLLPDLNPKGEVAKSYNTYIEEGEPAPAIYLIDKRGKMAWDSIINTEADGVPAALESLYAKQGKRAKVWAKPSKMST